MVIGISQQGNIFPLASKAGATWKDITDEWDRNKIKFNDDDDIGTWNLVRERARKNGMLIIYRRKAPENLPLLPEVCPGKLLSGEFLLHFRSQNGKSKKTRVWFGYLPPHEEAASSGISYPNPDGAAGRCTACIGFSGGIAR